jgi:HAMP domain-containing protein
MVGLGTAAYLRTQSILRQESLEQMTFALRSQVNAVEQWFFERESTLLEIVQDRQLSLELNQLTQNPDDQEAIGFIHDRLLDLHRLDLEMGFSELLVINRASGIVLSGTDSDHFGESLSLPETVKPGSIRIVSLIEDQDFSSESGPFLVVATFSDREDFVLGALISVNEVTTLLSSLETYWPIVDNQGIARGRTLLVIPPDTVVQSSLAEPSFEIESRSTHPVFSSLDSFTPTTTSYNSAPGEVELASFNWIADRDIGVVVERQQGDILAGLINLAPFLGVMILFATSLTFLVIILVTNRTFQPLTSLAEFARRISSGDWHFRVPEDHDKDLGGLASSLNRMATELGQLYQSLEERVEDRTRQIQIASEVARAVITIPNLDELLRQGVELIKTRFGYDHVSIFLLDREGSNAILRETSSGEVEALKTLGYKLKVGSKSVVGMVTRTNEPRISSELLRGGDIELDELLPGARSEVAIPLQVAGNPLGALAIQSLQPDAFKNEDIEVLQTLADQLSAAIENVRLAQESTNAAERARLVSEITSQISGLMEPEQVLQATAQALHRALGEAEIMIRLASPDEGVQQPEE